MAENPLLPHRKLRDMYALMVRCRGLDRKYDRRDGRSPKGPAPGVSRLRAREAWLAATSMHLVPGDLLCAQPGDSTAEQLAPAARNPSLSSRTTIAPADPRFLLCAALARGLQAAGNEGIVLVYAELGPASGNHTGWTTALEWAQSAQLPLLLACTDSTGGRAANRRSRKTGSQTSEPPLDLDAMNRFAQQLRLPVMPVDGEDAVAVYRVMQECALRARLGGGPAVLWGVLTPLAGAGGLQRSAQPIPRLKGYMAARGISLP